MNVQTILDRIKQHKDTRQQLITQITAYDGAIQEAEYWLSILDKTEPIDFDALKDSK